MSKPAPLPLNSPVSSLWGVGPERTAQLARLEVHSIEDLLLLRQRRYEDRRTLTPLGELKPGVVAAARGRIVAQGVKYWRQRSKSVFELILEDGTGRLHCRWWQMPHLEDRYQVGDELVVFGKVSGLKPRAMDHPETEVITGEGPEDDTSVHHSRIVPIYPLTEGLSQRWLRALVWRVLGNLEADSAPASRGVTRLERTSAGTGDWPDLALPGFPDRSQAIHDLHFPAELPAAEAARRRLALEEFLQLQLMIQRRRRNLQQSATAFPCRGHNRLIRPFLAGLPFKLTAAQTRVLRELRQDLGGACPMRRLLQGDVGSGKTVVAACCALMTLESGFDVALMAPTELLAEQHFRTFGGWFSPLGVAVELQTGSRRAQTVCAPVNARGQPPATSAPEPAAQPSPPMLFIGTHALLEEGFTPARLGLVIIDEQHKFGVAQREQLVRKGRYPHLLVMTATPIPRTLVLTLYGDLDISVIDALPAGRGRIRSFVRDANRLPQVYEFVRKQLAAGRQAYVVYPRVEDGDLKTGMKAVRQETERLRTACAPHAVGVAHGRLSSVEREQVMRAFRAGEVRVLLATSVIEVGVDVPNATIMLIENAESFGLAQLHQLRGRIGRGAHEAFCILIAAARTAEARQRLRVLTETTDGFLIAEEDLRLRGPGELLGKDQSGLPRFRFGDLAQDAELIGQARLLAAQSHFREAAPTPAAREPRREPPGKS